MERGPQVGTIHRLRSHSSSTRTSPPTAALPGLRVFRPIMRELRRVSLDRNRWNLGLRHLRFLWNQLGHLLPRVIEWRAELERASLPHRRRRGHARSGASGDNDRSHFEGLRDVEGQSSSNFIVEDVHDARHEGVTAVENLVAPLPVHADILCSPNPSFAGSAVRISCRREMDLCGSSMPPAAWFARS